MEFVLFALIVAAAFAPIEALTIAMVLIVLFAFVDPFRPSREPIFLGASYFAVILLAGLVGAAHNGAYEAAKDVWYVGNAVLTLQTGHILASRTKNMESALRTVVIAAGVVAVIHICMFVYQAPDLEESVVDLRAQMGAGYLISALGIAVIANASYFQIPIFRSRIWGAVLILPCLASVVLSLSRTLWVATATLVLLPRLFKDVRYLKYALYVLVLVMVLLLTGVGLTVTGSEIAGDDTFVEKVVGTLAELGASDYDSIDAINHRWRGFEAYRALQEFASGTPVNYAVGKGFGRNIDLGFTMVLADEEFDKIPILHNGYLYLLVKTGIIGVGVYLLYLRRVFLTGGELMESRSQRHRFVGAWLVVLVAFLLESTLVIAGVFNKYWVYPATLLTGLLTGYAQSMIGVPERRSAVPSVGGAPLIPSR